MAHEVAVIAFPGISPFHLSVPTMVFGNVALEQSPYRVRVCAVTPGPMPTSAGYDISVRHGLGILRTADTVVLPSWDLDLEPPAALVRAVRAAHRRGARIVGLCLGAFVVAAADIADGRELATHWHAAPTCERATPARPYGMTCSGSTTATSSPRPA